MGPAGGIEICPDCGQDVIRRYRVRATGEEFWLCEECDSVWRDGDDRSAPAPLSLSSFLPSESNPWRGIERADVPPPGAQRQPEPLRALVDMAGKGEVSGLALGMHRTDVLVVAGVRPEAAAIGVVDAGDVSMTFEGGTLAGFSVRLPPDGVRWPGIMTLSTAPRPSRVPREEALGALREAGFEPSGDVRVAEFWTDGRRVRLEFDEEMLTAVSVSRASN